MNKVLNTLLSHRSIRSYLDKPVSKEDLDLIIEAVQKAPNWNNAQLVSIIAIKDKERKKRIARLCGNQKHIEEAPVFLVFCADYYRTNLASQKQGISINETLEEDIDTLIVGSHEVGIALGTAVAAAESLNLSTVPIGDARKNALEMIEELKLPEYVIPLIGLCIGYAAQDPDMKPRLPKEAVYFEETYQKEDLEKKIAEFDETYAEYLGARSYNNRSETWTEQVLKIYSQPYRYKDIAEMLRLQKLPGGKD